MTNNNHNIKVRLNRSELAVPGSRVEFFEKAAQSEADVVFLDLEDSVSINQKSIIPTRHPNSKNSLKNKIKKQASRYFDVLSASK